jgi:hypothetical protein
MYDSLTETQKIHIKQWYIKNDIDCLLDKKQDLKDLGFTLGLDFSKHDVEIKSNIAVFINPPLYIKENNKDLNQLMKECDLDIARELGLPDFVFAKEVTKLIELRLQNKKDELITAFLELAFYELLDELEYKQSDDYIINDLIENDELVKEFLLLKPINVLMDLNKFDEILLELRIDCIDKNITIHNKNGYVNGYNKLFADKYIKINDIMPLLDNDNYKDKLNDIICTDADFEWTINTPEPFCYDIDLIKQNIESEYAEKAGLLLKVFDLQRDNEYTGIFNKYRKD